MPRQKEGLAKGWIKIKWKRMNFTVAFGFIILLLFVLLLLTFCLYTISNKYAKKTPFPNYFTINHCNCTRNQMNTIIANGLTISHHPSSPIVTAEYTFVSFKRANIKSQLQLRTFTMCSKQINVRNLTKKNTHIYGI